MRDIIAALLRARGYAHDDEADPGDMYWRYPTGGYAPILACVAQEFGDQMGICSGWETYMVSTPVPVTYEPASSAPTITPKEHR